MLYNILLFLFLKEWFSGELLFLDRIYVEICYFYQLL